ncbi:uncharacterized protein LOC134533106 [Bacillus rossius redtenbacheri]|uniref:uncharacterized protein LOC134533106 n=1 Tax=Bacillus rossius redtenbacheri TaxID=93214 RepID=UPI002FDE9F5D
MLLLFLILTRLVCETTPLNATSDAPKVDREVSTQPENPPPSILSARTDQVEPGAPGKPNTLDEEAINSFLKDFLKYSGPLNPPLTQINKDNATDNGLPCYGCDRRENVLDVPYHSVFYLPYADLIYYWLPQQGPEHALTARRALIGHGNIVAGGLNGPRLRKVGVAGHGGVAVLKSQKSPLVYTRNHGLRSGFLGHAGGVGYIGRHRTRNADEKVPSGEASAGGSPNIAAESPNERQALFLPGAGLGPYYFGLGLPTVLGGLASPNNNWPLNQGGYVSQQGTISTYQHPLFRQQDGGNIDKIDTVGSKGNGNCYDQFKNMAPTQDFRSVGVESQGSQNSFGSENYQLTSDDAPGSVLRYSPDGSSYYEGAILGNEDNIGYFSGADSNLHSGINGMYGSAGPGVNSPVFSSMTSGLQPGLAQSPFASSLHFPLEGLQGGLSGHELGSTIAANGLHSHLGSSHSPHFYPMGGLHSGFPSPSLATHNAGSLQSSWPGYGLQAHSLHPTLGSLFGNSQRPGAGYAQAIGGLQAMPWGHNAAIGQPGFGLSHPYNLREAGDNPPGETGVPLPGLPTGQSTFPAGPGVDAPLDLPPPSLVPYNTTDCNGSASGYSFRKYSHSDVDYGYGELPGQSAYLRLLMVHSGSSDGLPPQRQSYQPSPPVAPYQRVHTKQGYDILKFSHDDSAEQPSQN